MGTRTWKGRPRRTSQADVSEIARLFGGGGHKAAAGCGFQGTAIDDLFVSQEDEEAVRRAKLVAEWQPIIEAFAAAPKGEKPLSPALNSYERAIVHELAD